MILRNMVYLMFLVACGPKKNGESSESVDEINQHRQSCDEGSKSSCRALEKNCKQENPLGCFQAGKAYVST